MHVSCPGWKAEVQISILTLLSWRQANVYRFSITEWISTLFIRRTSDMKTNMILSKVTWISRRSSPVVSSSRQLVIFWLYSALRVVRVIKSRRMRWTGHVARMGEERGRIGSWWGNRKERDHWGDLGVDGWIILGWVSRRWDVGMWTGLGWPRIGTGGGRLWVR